MIVFIDESGDPGFKTSRGSSLHFVVALVVFDDELDAEEAALKIKRLRKSLGLSDQFEFKFNKCKKALRLSFLEDIKSCKFKIRAIVFDKESMYSNYLRNNKDNFYNFALRQVLDHNQNTIIDAKIRLDGLGEKSFRQQLTTYLRQCLNSRTKRVMKNLRFKDSKRDVLIQMADMIAGSLRRYFDKTQSDWDEYRKLNKRHEVDIWEFK
jgi:hypothetical protein